MLVQFGNNWIPKIPLTAKLDSACGLVQFWLSSEFFSSNYIQIGQYVVLLHVLIGSKSGASFLNQSRSVVNAKPITFRHSNENRSNVTNIPCVWQCTILLMLVPVPYGGKV